MEGGVENFHSTGNQIFLSLISPLGLIGYDGFLCISFYFLQDSQFKTERFVKLFLQVFFYSLVMVVVSYILNVQTFYTGSEELSITNLSFRQILAAFFPISGSSHPYASIYMLFYLSLPFVQRISESITQRQNLLLIMLLFYFEFLIRVIQSVIGYAGTVTATSYGSFLFIYFIVVYLKRNRIELMQNTKTWKAVFLITYLLQSLLRFLHYYHCENRIIKVLTTFYLWGGSWAPLNIISGISVLCIGISIKTDSRIINSIAKGTFAVLLIHDNNYFRYIIYSKVFRIQSFLPSMPTAICALSTFAISIFVFGISITIDFIRRMVLERNIMNLRFLDSFCKRIDSYLDVSVKSRADG